MKTYNDPAKQLWRVKLREFIAEHILPYRNPRTVRVACFPGAEIEGEEGLEIKEVYDPLGIPRENIVGLERDAECAQRLRHANLGIEVVEEDALDYFMHPCTRPFQIINLDYLGQMTLKEGKTLESIASQQHLDHHGILATNFFGSREGDAMKKLLSFRVIIAKKWQEFLSLPLEVRQMIVADASKTWNLDFMREGLTHEIFITMASGTANYPVVRNYFSDDPRKHETMAHLEEQIAQDNPEEHLDQKIKQEELERFHAEIRSFKLIKLLTEKNLTNELASSIHSIKITSAQQGYIPKAINRYEYTSNTGSPMLADFFAFQNLPKRLVYAAEGLVRYTKTPQGNISVNINPAHMSPHQFQKQAERFMCMWTEICSLIREPRIRLDSGAPASRNVEQKAPCLLHYPNPSEKAEIYAWIRDGSASDAELCQTYSITPRQLGSYKAHVTMQNHEQKERTE